MSDSNGSDLETGVLQDCWKDEKNRPMIKVRWLYGKDQVDEMFSRNVRGKKKAPADLEQVCLHLLLCSHGSKPLL